MKRGSVYQAAATLESISTWCWPCLYCNRGTRRYRTSFDAVARGCRQGAISRGR